jgi:type I restriction enzyme S subunit
MPLGAVAQVNMGQSPASAFYNTVGKGLPLIQGNADCKDRKTLPTTYTSEITKRAHVGDIVMSVRAPVGTIAKCTQEVCIGRGVCAINGEKIDNDFLYQFLLSHETSWGSYAQGSTFTAVNGNDIRKLEILFPEDQKEQKNIAGILSVVDRELYCLTGVQVRLKLQKHGLMQKLLTGKIRVKI